MLLNVKKNITYKNDNQKTTNGKEKEKNYPHIKKTNYICNKSK